jgi:hypothetical protein
MEQKKVAPHIIRKRLSSYFKEKVVDLSLTNERMSSAAPSEIFKG